MHERDIMDAIRSAMAPHCRLWRNNVGMYRKGEHTIRYGLAVGTSDLIGFTRIGGDVGDGSRAVLVFTAIEVKRPGGRLTDSQANFIEYITEHGGIAIVADDPVECVAEHRRQVQRITGLLFPQPSGNLVHATPEHL